jgi:SH3-like domain-containing protein
VTNIAPRIVSLLAFIAGLACVQSALAEAAPKFMSLRTDSANGRRGPAADQPVLFVYKARGLPLQVLAASGEYLHLRDPDSDEVWIHKSQLSSRRTVFVLPADRPLALRRGPEDRGRPVAILEPRVLAALEGCDGPWRKLTVDGHTGWAPAKAIFGAASCEGVEP